MDLVEGRLVQYHLGGGGGVCSKSFLGLCLNPGCDVWHWTKDSVLFL